MHFIDKPLASMIDYDNIVLGFKELQISFAKTRFLPQALMC